MSEHEQRHERPFWRPRTFADGWWVACQSLQVAGRDEERGTRRAADSYVLDRPVRRVQDEPVDHFGGQSASGQLTMSNGAAERNPGTSVATTRGGIPR